MLSEAHILTILKKHISISEIKGVRKLAGSFENSIMRISTEKGDFIIKTNAKQNTTAEVKGLALLTSTNTVNVPQIIGFGETGEKGYLVLELLGGSRNRNYWSLFGEKLAKLHQTKEKEYGLSYDNFIGALPQTNQLKNSWVDFFVDCRITPQLQLAGQILPVKVLDGFEKLISKLPDLLPEECPAVIHGDLWGGNVLTNFSGEATLIDPAVYYANREIEIAFTHLFGGFDDEFYDSYQSTFPLPKDFEERIDLYNLYPLLVHVNMFGGSYVGQVQTIIRRFL
jgi:protein-ribulosamine 3-kinase